MTGEKLLRRDFLKVTIATVAVQGLSHFRFLNFSGISSVSAYEGEPDENNCIAAITGICQTYEDQCAGAGTDICPEPSADTCAPPEDWDHCDPPRSPEDTCDPFDNPPDNSSVALSGMKAQGSILPALGGVATLVAGAALWIKRRLPHTEYSKD